MDFNKLMQRMRDLDQPVGEQAVQECGMDPMMGNMSSPMSMTPPSPPPTPPTLTVNLNAQGMDDIEGILRLMTKVNPDMINQPSSMQQGPDVLMPQVTPIPTIGSIGGDGAGDVSAMAALRDKLDGPEDSMEPVDGDEMNGDDMSVAQGDVDNDGDHDMADHDAEEDDSEEEEETDEGAYGNSAQGSEGPESKGSPFDQEGTDLNKPKPSFPKAAGGDNPMNVQRNEGKDALRASIRAELLSRLNEAKGVR